MRFKYSFIKLRASSLECNKSAKLVNHNKCDNILSNSAKLKQITTKVMDQYQAGDKWKKGQMRHRDILTEEARKAAAGPDLSEHERRRLGIKEKGIAVKTDTTVISTQNAIIKDKEGDLQAQKTNKEVKKLKDEVKKVGNKVSNSGVGIEQTQINSSQQIITSIDESSAVSTGGGSQNPGGVSDLWYINGVMTGGT